MGQKATFLAVKTRSLCAENWNFLGVQRAALLRMSLFPGSGAKIWKINDAPGRDEPNVPARDPGEQTQPRLSLPKGSSRESQAMDAESVGGGAEGGSSDSTKTR